MPLTFWDIAVGAVPGLVLVMALGYIILKPLQLLAAAVVIAIKGE